MRLFQGWTSRLLSAVRGNGRPLRTLFRRGLSATCHPPPEAPLHAVLEAVDPPPTLDRASAVPVAVRVKNVGAEAWQSRGRYRVELAYRWFDHEQTRLISAGDRVRLPRTIPPGGESILQPRVVVPDALGDLCLRFDIILVNSDNSLNEGTSLSLPCLVDEPETRDCDYVAWYHRADLRRDHWRIVGPETKELYDRLSAAQFRILLDLGLTPDSAVLDVGCGTGKLAGPLETFLSERGLYHGTDIGAEAVEFCRSRFRRPNFIFATGEMTRLPFAGVLFDQVVFFSVLTHTYPDESRRLLAEARRLLKPGGLVLADVLTSPLVKHHAGRRGGVMLSENLLPRIAAECGLRAELLERLCHPWGRYGRRLFFKLTACRDASGIMKDVPENCRC